MIYKLYPPKKSNFFDELDRKKRQKVEEVLNKQMSDFEWLEYKKMTLPKDRNQK